jgi:hypothetical protein
MGTKIRLCIIKNFSCIIYNPIFDYLKSESDYLEKGGKTRKGGKIWQVFLSIRVMLVVPLLNSSISILVLHCSCVSSIASNRNVNEFICNSL